MKPYRPTSLDIDGVLANFGKGIIRVAQALGVYDDNWPKRWYYQEEFFPLIESFMVCWNKVKNDPDFWLSLDPFWDDPWPNYTPTSYVTSRSIDKWVTIEWLRGNGFPDAPVFNAPNPLAKSSFLEPGQVFVEDRADAFEQLRKDGIDCYLLDRPWNRHVQTTHRIYTVNEV